MKPLIRLLTGAALWLLAVVVVLALVPRAEERRLATLKGDGLRLAVLYNRTRTDPRPVDVAFFGSSHTVNGIDDAGLEADLAARHLPVKVANMGMFVMGRDLQYRLVRQLFTYRRPRLVVLEINEHVAPLNHPYMPYVGQASDLLACGPTGNLPTMGLLFLKQQWLGLTDALLPARAPLPTLPQAPYGWQPLFGVWSGQANPPSFGDKLERIAGKTARMGLYRATDYYEDCQVARIANLVRARGARLMFLYLPEYKYAADPDPGLIARYSRWGQVIVVPSDIAEDRSDWADHAHLNHTGSEALRAALDGPLASALTPLQSH